MGDIICRAALLDHQINIFRGLRTLDFSFSYVLLELSILLVLTQICRFLLKPLRQPKVISDLIAGIIIGPSLLGRNKKFQSYVFSDTSQYVTRNIGVIGFMYFVFISGVKMDLGVIRKSGKKQWTIALAGVILPHVVVVGLAFGIRHHMDKEMAKFATFGGMASAIIVTTFPVIYTVLQDLHLLSSEIGRLALSIVVISDVIGINIIVAFEATKQAESRSMNALYYTVTLIVVISVVIGGIPKIMAWINSNTPEGKSIDPNYVTFIFLGVFVIGFVTDFMGAAIANGPLWLGLAIPDGPPLGATLVDKSEMIMTQLLLPFSFASIGMLTNVYELKDCWSCLGPLFVMTIAGYISKFFSVLIASQYFAMPFREGLTLSLMMSLRGQMEFLLYVHWLDWRMINTQHFTMMVLLTVANTSICAPLIGLLYDPTRPYMTNKRRTIQHNQPNSDLRVMACIHDQDCVTSLFSLLDVSNPSPSNPFSIFALHLIELKGRASPVFIDHSQQDEYWDSTDESIHNALKIYEEPRSEYMSVHFLTSVAALRTMYQDICEMSLIKKASFIILPFHKKSMVALTGPGTVRTGVQSINYNCLMHAPCSVGILVCKGSLQPSVVVPNSPISREPRRFAMLFLGGPDAREALTYADRMVGNPATYLTVVRFLSHNYEGDDEMERKLDDGVVTWFWVKNERNERVIYREVVVKNGADTVTAIQAMNEDDGYDLWIVGRKNGVNPVVLQGLSDWSENPELGMVGDFLSSVDFSVTASVLVVQQQVLRDQSCRSFGILA